MVALIAAIGVLVFGGLVGFAGFTVLSRRNAFRDAGDRRSAELLTGFGLSLLGYLAGSVFLHLTYPRYFWLVMPSPSDTEHLPGGTDCRYARDHTVFAGLVTDLIVSSKPSPLANYLGSSVCLDCHTGHATAAQHAHRLGIAVPDSLGPLQDISRYADFELGWDMFLDAATPQGGTAVYYSDYDPSRGTDKFKTSLTDPSPGETVFVRAWLWRDTGDQKFKISLENMKNPADPRNGPPLYTLEVPLSYGGAVEKQAYLCRVPGRSGLYPLLQFHTDQLKRLFFFHFSGFLECGHASFKVRQVILQQSSIGWEVSVRMPLVANGPNQHV